ncbi:MAG: DASS family sodium-coupled anion symporter, partial [Bacteroidia bacterium]|nr:DASS family sodium-coupled anion symporter [Bacteroidia bacterium]
TRPHQLLFGFMLSTALLSMWMSNTATVVMMLPMALAVIRTIEKDNPQIGPALLLGVAYSASIGGMATLIGTPPNLVFSGVLEQQVNEPISFIKWMSIALPVSVFLLFITWWILKRPFLTNGISLKVKDLKQHTTITRSEKTVLLIFIITAFSWILRVPLLNVFIPQLNDTHIALIGGLSLLIIPYNKNNATPILSWSDTQKLPWGTLILFGGGLSLASAFDQTGVASWLGSIIEVYAQNWNPLFVIMSTVLLINFTTEITSNLATTAVMLPILLPISEICHIPALLLLGSATLSASCAFMLPVATAPNALVFGSGKISVRYMVKNGIILNLISSISISLAFYFLMIYSQ